MNWLNTALGFLSSTPIVSGFGVLSLGALFAFNKILTVGQHKAILKAADDAHDKLVSQMAASQAAAIAELLAHHSVEMTELRTSRDYYRKARLDEQAQRIKLGDQLIEGYNAFGQIASAMTAALDETAKE